MVTLPELESYTPADHKYLDKLSPIFERYRNIIGRKTSSFSQDLKCQRHRYWLQAAYATFLAKASTEDICYFWSLKADELIKQSWQHCGLDELPVSLFAFGKLGSRELNLSSDIDVVFIRSKTEEIKTMDHSLRQWIQLLSHTDDFGFVFRVDTSIRPGGETSPLSPEVDQFIHYYGYMGEAWNRISFVRLRPILGDKKLIDSIEGFCKGFSYPRRLDYSIVNNIKNLRIKIKNVNFNSKDQINIKFAPGGIRDIELYLQSLQVIYGGRKEALRKPSISKNIETLGQLGILSKEEAHFFKNFYWELRTLENYIQGCSDQHTYTLNENLWPLVQKVTNRENLEENLIKSEAYISSFFAGKDSPPLFKEKPAESMKLSSKSKDAINEIINLKSSSLKKSDVENQKRQLLSKFLEITQRITLNPDLAIQSFKDFIFSIKSKSSIFYMLNKKPDLMEHLVWLFSYSPYIGQVLCSRPELLDSFALGSVEIQENSKDIESLLEDLLDFKLLTQMISASHFLKTQDVSAFTHQLSMNTNTIAKTLMDYLLNEFSSKEIDILRLGKWGGEELGLHSDLDFVFVTPNTPNKSQLQVARRFINLVSSPSRGGRLFSIDLRLKPNEQAGPLIVSQKQLEEFLEQSAEAWQKQAYLKSRFLFSNQCFYKTPPPLTKDEFQELEMILSRLLKNKNQKSVDIKYNPGGLLHTEFRLQIEVLKKQVLPKSGSTQDLFNSLPNENTEIWSNYSFLRQFEQLFGLCTDLSSPRVGKNHPSLSRIGQVLKIENPYKKLEKILDEQDELLKSLDANH